MALWTAQSRALWQQTSSIAPVRAQRSRRWHRLPIPGHGRVVAHTAVLEQPRVAVLPHNSIVPGPSVVSGIRQPEATISQPVLPIFTALSDEVCTASPQALRAGLKALKCVGVWGVALDVWWGAVETGPRKYDWSQVEAVLHMAQEIGLRVRVAFCFHSNEKHTLPAWVLRHGQACPDIFYTDRAGNRNTECLSLGVDDVPVLGGRTAVQAYAELVAAFAERFAHLLGSTVTDAEVGLGPKGELRYPSTPSDRRWTFPGVGEFQCYDRFVLASLQACAHHVGQPHWGLGGPHDAGSYCQWPHQTGFFHPRGSWDSEYGHFFLQWYSGLLVRHADRVLSAARRALARGGGGFAGRVRLHARLPMVHWWYAQAAHAAELAAGIYNSYERDGYLPLLQVMARHGVGLHVSGADARCEDQPAHALSDPEALLQQMRGGAAALQVPVTLANGAPTFDADALSALSARALGVAGGAGGEGGGAYRCVDLPPADALVFGRMGDTMFEPANWAAFRDWVASVREGGSGANAPRPASPAPALQPVLQQQQQQLQQQQQPAMGQMPMWQAAAEQVQEQQQQQLQQQAPQSPVLV